MVHVSKASWDGNHVGAGKGVNKHLFIYTKGGLQRREDTQLALSHEIDTFFYKD